MYMYRYMTPDIEALTGLPFIPLLAHNIDFPTGGIFKHNTPTSLPVIIRYHNALTCEM